MTTEQEQICITVKAEADLSSYQYRLMTMTNSGYGTLCLHSGTVGIMLGILQNKPAAYGRAAKICIAGHTKAIAGAAITTLGHVGIHSAGALQAAVTYNYSLVGINITTAAGSGEYFEMIVDRARQG